MKRTLLRLLTLLLMSLLFAGCFACADTDPKPSEPMVVCTVFPCYDLARAVGEEFFDIRMLVPPEGEPHGFEPTVRERAWILEADLFLYCGGESDAWAEDLITKEAAVPSLSLLDCVEEALLPTADEHQNYDEHVYTSPVLYRKMLEQVTDALVAIAPELEEHLRANAAEYDRALAAVDEELRQTVADASGRLLIFSERFPFLYFCEEYGLDHLSALNGCSENSEVGFRTLADLIDTILRENVPVVLYTELSDQESAATIAAATGVRTLCLHSCHSVSKQDFIDGVTYVDLMRQNAAVLKEALN